MNERIKNYREHPTSDVDVKEHSKFPFYFNIVPRNDEVLKSLLDDFGMNVYKRETYAETEDYLVGYNQFWKEFYIVEKESAEAYLDQIYQENYHKGNIQGLYLNEYGYHEFLPVPFPMYVAGTIGKYNFNFIAYHPGCLISKKGDDAK